MAKTKKPDSGKKLVSAAIKGLQEKKGREIASLDLRNLKNAVTDYFVVCHAASRTNVLSLAAAAEEAIHKATGESPWHREGFENAEWVLLDYVNMVVHIFLEDARTFYGIERLWADADIKKAAGAY